MTTDKQYLDFIMDCMSELDGITFRPMMGEYIIYYQGKIIGGIYDNRFLIKPHKAAKDLMISIRMEIPYPGAKEMLMVEELEDIKFLKKLIETLASVLPLPKPKIKKRLKS